jgi:hypothetical protein
VQCIRQPLANRRPCETFEFTHDGIDYVVTVGRFDDGRLAEIFVNGGKLDSAVDFMIRDSAIAASLALQHGCSAHALAAALTRVADDKPGGPIGVLLMQLLGDHQ